MPPEGGCDHDGARPQWSRRAADGLLGQDRHPASPQPALPSWVLASLTSANTNKPQVSAVWLLAEYVPANINTSAMLLLFDEGFDQRALALRLGALHRALDGVGEAGLEVHDPDPRRPDRDAGHLRHEATYLGNP